MARRKDLFLSEDEKADLVSKIKDYFEDERDEQLGNMEVLFILDFFVKELGPVISLKAIRRYKEQIEIRLEDTEVDVISTLNFEN